MGIAITDLDYLLDLKARGHFAELNCVYDIGATQLYLGKNTEYLNSLINQFIRKEKMQQLSNSE